jgi:hypothetical protein
LEEKKYYYKIEASLYAITEDMINIENEIDNIDGILDVSVYKVKDKQEIENLKHLKEFVETLETKNELQKEMEKR